MNDMVSVIVPVYNVEHYLEKCLKSLQLSIYTNLEILLIDDGSTDSSGDICDKYEKIDKRCKVYHKENGGLPDARNYGLDRANGKYIMFIDSDDWIDKCCVQNCINEFEKDNNVDCVMFPYIREFNNKSVKTFILGEENKKYIGNEVKEKIHRRFWGLLDDELKNPLALDQLNMAWGKLYKADLIGNTRFTPVDIIGSSEDNWFNAQVFANSKTVVYITNTFYHYNKENESSIVHSYRPNLIKTKNNLHEFLFNYAVNNNYDDKYIIALKNRKILNMLDYVRNILNIGNEYKKVYGLINDLLENNRYIYLEFRFDKLPIKWRFFYFACYKQSAIGVLVMVTIAEKIKKYIH